MRWQTDSIHSGMHVTMKSFDYSLHFCSEGALLTGSLHGSDAAATDTDTMSTY